MNHYIPISGKDSLLTAIIQTERAPSIKYTYIYNEVGAELPEIREWLTKIEDRLNIKIKRIGANLTEIIHSTGILPSPMTRFCTRAAKIEPMENYIDKPATIYYGLRYDEPNRQGYTPNSGDITAVYPLREAKVNRLMVYTILGRMELLPPLFFWNDMYKRVKKKMGPQFAPVEKLPIWVTAPLFAWRSRPNCSYCFYQRQYEIVGLYEHHPDLFHEAAKMEKEIGGDNFTLIKEGSLFSFIERAEQIKERRAREIVKYLTFNINVSMNELIPLSSRYESDDLNATSCGLLCGK